MTLNTPKANVHIPVTIDCFRGPAPGSCFHPQTLIIPDITSAEVSSLEMTAFYCNNCKTNIYLAANGRVKDGAATPYHNTHPCSCVRRLVPIPTAPQDLYNPVYEELSDAESEMVPAPHSEDEFAEDELSLAGEMERRRLEIPRHRTDPRLSLPDEISPGSDLCHRVTLRRMWMQHDGAPPHYAVQVPQEPHEPLPPVPSNKRHRSLDRRRQEFPRGNAVGRPPAAVPQALRVGPGAGAFGDVSTRPQTVFSGFGVWVGFGYSNHTSSGTSRGRRDPRRLSQLSADLALT
ncbi:hypothetical protein NQ317_006979 [Molorchus minor]|uniref:Uncharacterized protein n=1 Tax=Molorchus minor TaxID=1323400 RepID=A0ABQ9IQF9_9CUCU|nr:hypothetical protein NQ317_006979 [Molorchus minor]